jgi:hypothetical protein
MDIGFGTWNVKSLYWSGSRKEVSRETGKRKLDLVGVKKLDGTRAALNQLTIIHSNVEMGMLITTVGQAF